MKKEASSKNGKTRKRVLATKKASPPYQEVTPLNLSMVSEAELKASRNPAYGYLVK